MDAFPFRVLCHLTNFHNALKVSGNNSSMEREQLPSRAMTTIFETRAHSSKNSSTQVSTFSDKNETTASVVSYIILLDGRMILAPALFPIGCCTYFSLTQVTTCGFISAYNPNRHNTHSSAYLCLLVGPPVQRDNPDIRHRRFSRRSA